MTSAFKTEPSCGRLFKLFTDLGPYFRKQQSTERLFFFDCLEICIDSEKEPEEREFYGWWLELEKDENSYNYKRFDGRYNLAGNWIVENVCSQDQQQLDMSFELFLKRLETLIDIESGLKLEKQQVALIEA